MDLSCVIEMEKSAKILPKKRYKMVKKEVSENFKFQISSIKNMFDEISLALEVFKFN